MFSQPISISIFSPCLVLFREDQSTRYWQKDSISELMERPEEKDEDIALLDLDGRSIISRSGSGIEEGRAQETSY